MSGESALSQVISAFWFVLPAYFANGGALVLGGGRPLDASRCLWDGRRVFGDGVTVRGTVGGTAVGTLVGALQMGAYGLPRSLALGLALGGGAMVGDILGSFLKRRINIARGNPAPGLDQLGFLLVALAFGALVVPISFRTFLILIILTPLIHLVTNAIAYQLGMKKVWY